MSLDSVEGVPLSAMQECKDGVPAVRATFQLLTNFHAHSVEHGSLVLSSTLGESLAAYLLLNRSQPVSRVRIVRLLWPDLPEGEGRRRLSKLLWRLRTQGLDPVIPLIATDSHLQVDPDAELTIDVEVFRSGIDALRAKQVAASSDVSIADLEAVARIYRGPLLEQNEAEWLVAERQELAEHFASLLRWLVKVCREQGDLDGALTWARRLLEAEPLVEEYHQEVMRLCILQNRASEARSQFEACRSMLRLEFDLSPSSESLALLGEVERTVTHLDGAKRASIIGRQSTRAQLAEQLDRSASGISGIALIEGEPGFGKTVLLDELTARARDNGMSVIRVEHTERSAAKAYGGLSWSLAHSLRGVHGEHVAETLDNRWLASAARVIPGLTAGSELQALRPGDEEVWRQHESLAHVILAHGRVRPTLLVLDDVHWADDDTMSVLRHVVGQIDTTNLLIAAGYRKHEVLQRRLHADTIAYAESRLGAVVHQLAPLGFLESAELVESIDSSLDSTSVDWLIAQTGGNPFFIVETIRGMVRVDPVPPSGHGHEPLVADSISGIITKRFHALSAEARSVATALAVLGRPVTIVDLCQLASANVNVLGPSFDELASAGFTNELGGVFSLRHDQVRATIISITAPDRQRTLHHAATNVLLSASDLDDPIPWDEVAHHARCSQQWDIAADAARLAAVDAAKVHANDLAAGHLEDVLDAYRRMDPERIDSASRTEVLFELEAILELLGERERQAKVLSLLVEASEVIGSNVDPLRLAGRRALHLADTGRPQQALDVLVGAVEGASDAAETSLRILRGTILNRAGQGNQAVQVLEGAVHDLIAEGNDAAAARCVLASALSELQDHATARRQVAVALEESERNDDVRTLVEALGCLARVDGVGGRTGPAEASFGRAIELSNRIGYRRGEAINSVNLSTLYAMTGRGGLALRAFDQAMQMFVSMDDERGRAFVLANRADVRCWLLGDLDGAESDARQAIKIFRVHDDTHHESMGLDVLANVSRIRRRFVASRKLLSRAIEVAEDNQLLVAQAIRSQARVEIDQGRFLAALDLVNDGHSICKELGLDTLTPFFLALEARALLGLGKVDEALLVAGRTGGEVDDDASLAHLVLWWCAAVMRHGDDADALRAIERRAGKALERALEGLSDRERALALTRVAEHEEIDQERQRQTTKFVHVELPDISVPTGRPVRPSELVPVRWTIMEPSDYLLENRVDRRRTQLTRLIGEAASQGGAPRLSDLSDAVGASAATIKRDLAHLRDLGYQLATRGTHV